MNVAQQHSEVGHIIDRLALETFFEQMAIAPILAVIVVHIGTGYALDGFAHALLAFPNEQMEVIRHEAIGIVGTIGSAGFPVVIKAHAHPVEGDNELIVVLGILEDVLVVDTTHHDVIDACA